MKWLVICVSPWDVESLAAYHTQDQVGVEVKSMNLTHVLKKREEK